MGGKRISHIFACCIFLIGCIFSLAAQQAISQINAALTQSVTFDQNIFRNNQHIDDWIYQTSLNLSHDFDLKKLQVRLNYAGMVNIFQSYSEKLYHIHTIGLESYLPIHSNGSLNIGTNYQQRINKPENGVYDHQNWLIYSQWKWNLWRQSPLHLAYQYRNRTYQNLTALSFHEHTGFLKLSRFLPTRTTLIGQLSLHSKQYSTQETIEETITPDTPNDGHGNNFGNGRHKYRQVQADTTIVTYNMNIAETYQWSLLVRMAQSIFPTTGLSVQYLRRFKPSQETRFLTGQIYSYAQEDELYDDPYTYSSDEYELTLTQLAPWSVKIEITINHDKKYYTYPAIVSLMDSVSFAQDNRNDTLNLVGVHISKPFALSRIIRNINVYFSYFRLNNRSNDPYFHFKTQLLDGGIELRF